MRKVAAVIGGTGYVGSHIVACLLQTGYTVRATCRDPSRSGWLRSLGEGVDLCELTLTPDGAADSEMDKVVGGCSAVFFCAGHEKQEPSTIPFMVNSALATVKAARRNSVGVVVVTSSGGSTNPAGLASGTPKSEIEHWSDPDQQESKGRYSPAAKTRMELAVLEEVGRNTRNGVADEARAEGAPRLCIMNPNLILGPQLQPGSISGNSLPWIVRILNRESMVEQIPNDSMSIIDVRDLAALHVACAESPSACGRYFGVNRSWPWEEILGALERASPGYSKPPRFEGESATPTQFDNTRKESLGVKLRSLDDTLTDLVAFLKERGALTP
jgi:nucleoside-diphosphate-sugar epimerase